MQEIKNFDSCSLSKITQVSKHILSEFDLNTIDYLIYTRQNPISLLCLVDFLVFKEKLFIATEHWTQELLCSHLKFVQTHRTDVADHNILKNWSKKLSKKHITKILIHPLTQCTIEMPIHTEDDFQHICPLCKNSIKKPCSVSEANSNFKELYHQKCAIESFPSATIILNKISKLFISL